MSNKNEVFEYLIDQLRQQINKKDVTSFNVSVQISDLDEVKQVIHNLQQHIAGKDDEIRALKDSLRQQVTNSPYKQQCEDLAHEVQSLKNQLLDASALVDELQEDNIKKSGLISHLTRQSSAYRNDALRFQAQVEDLVKRLAKATDDESAKIKELQREISVLANAFPREPEQYGCRKEDVQVEKSWVEHDGAAACPVPDDTVVGIKFRNGEVESNAKAFSWRWGTWGGPYDIVAYRVVKPECEHDFIYHGIEMAYKCTRCGLKK